MSTYTCITCRVAFSSSEIQRNHYKTDWHRYNLKRKVAEMPPVTSDDFCQRVLSQKAQLAQASQPVKSHCQVCNKNFSTENAFANHMQSKKHKEQEAKVNKELEKLKEKRKEKGLEEENNDKNRTTEDTSQGAACVKPKSKPDSAIDDDDDEGMEVEEVSDDEWDEYEGNAVPGTDCLFCSKSSNSIEENSHHMTVHHSFFIPHIEYLVDLEGLLTYLGEKVGCGFVCLWCNKRGKAFHALDAVQRHMRDKGHCKLQYDGDAAFEFSDFYDYRSSYPDYDGEKKVDVDMKEENEEEITEDVLNSTPDGYQLVLPSGAKIGHRELFRYYKQNIPPTREVAVRNNATIGKLNMQYKALGWYGNQGRVGEARLADLRFVQKFKAKPHLTMGMKNNKLKQKHYRPQVVF
ncbi:zinc finger protein 622-like isoform X2 [Anneissia japonica]|uniref:zinc finger protein 622-like isoform X2 n=1 Tax=Anneissia japonica TaxID=1529436 RepID=UPI0014255AF9|nr:zinc finger protein 622-like isoform X2 [Anneissia japonica]